MRDETSVVAGMFSPEKEADARRLAFRAINIMASKMKMDPARRTKSEIRELCDAVVGADEYALYELIARFIANGVTSQEICDCHVPAAARYLGECWQSDTLSFAEVSLGTSRLQHIVRQYSQRGDATSVLLPLRHSVLMIVPPNEDHTLGAMVAASQFRRMGLDVKMAIGLTHKEIGHIDSLSKYSMIGLSAGSIRSIETLTAVVSEIRNRNILVPPIVVGGKVIALVEDLAHKTDADLVTANPREALAFCGVRQTPAEDPWIASNV